MNQTIFNSILHETLHNNPECEAAAYIDLRYAIRLGEYFYSSAKQYDNDEMMNLITLTVTEIFNGKHMSALSNFFKYQENLAPNEEYFEKLTLKGTNHTHVYLRLNFNPNHIVAFVFSNHIVRGMMLNEVKQFAKQIQMVAEKTPIEVPVAATDEHTIHGTKLLPLPHPSLVFNTPTDVPEKPAESVTSDKKGDIVNMLDRWLKS